MTQSTIENAGRAIKTGDRFYQPELDVLRFFAFLGVFFFHLRPHSLLPESIHFAKPLVRLSIDAFTAGSFGVDLFFVLSAYLITELLLREKAGRGFLDVSAFYARRILRIWPLYFFFIGVAWLLQFFIQGQLFTWHYVLAFLLLSGNWICALHGLPPSVALPLWSVSIEEQFYLLWPQVVRRASVGRMKAVAVGMLVIASGSRFFLLMGHTTGSMLGYNTFTRFDGIAMGILISLVLRGKIQSFSAWARVFLILCGYLGFLIAADLLTGPSPDAPPSMVGGMLGFPLVGAASILILLSFLGLPLQEWRLVRWLRLVYLGKISYGLYVYHFLALLLARIVINPVSVALYGPYILLGLTLTIAMAAISYTFLERPFLSLKKRFTYVVSRPD